MVGLLGPYGRGPATENLPTRRAAVRAHQPTLVERAADPFANLSLARRFDGEQRAQVDVVVDALRDGVMWSERTRRLVVPMATKCHGDCRPRCANVAVGINGQDRLMGEWLAHASRLVNPISAAPATRSP